ncbi:hypothetical protein P9239_19205 [Caballeronia sp. LZ062]|uniref:hypothetical protein n=1 Tax=unclassified Caballeronia TaxID=2646786 RepID=UPI00285540ED|nr:MULTISPECIES: hypothetical protein [unclassified Caballeronia]MDR5855733.1 hypothetical protein [Caballeronia sp. LZ050]MDR5872480.1 hypothetical protein [Caballeronia sp. LZ062]
MNAKLVRATVVSTLLLTTTAVTLAAAGTDSSSSKPSARQAHEHEHGSMMGMQGMMGSCPMMGGNMGLDPKTAMRMHAEMMRAMSDIMTKYADQAGTPSSKQ